MRRFFHSLQWRIQGWHGAILLTVILLFGVPAYFINAEMHRRTVDESLRRRQAFMVERMLPATVRESFRSGPPWFPHETPWGMARTGGEGGPFFHRTEGEENPGPGSRRPMPPQDDTLLSLDSHSPVVFYYAVWSADKKLLVKSENAPADLIAPGEPESFPSYLRDRGDDRELITVGHGGQQMILGRSVAREKSDLRHFAWMLIVPGGGVLLLGLAGGWWLASRAIRPIKAIAETADKIAHGNLAERIDVADTDNELGQLAKILNHTFARLHDVFERQARFTSDASHELRTPVALILMKAQSALAQERSVEEYREALEVCESAAQRMRRLIESLLTLARMDSGRRSGEWVRCDLDRIVRETVELLRPLAAKYDVTVKLELAPAACLGDAAQIGLVISNLVSNALQYNRPGGEVKITVAQTLTEASMVVADTGQGIGEGDLPHIFERFYRTDEARTHIHRNHGLGLAIAQAVVKAHQGSLRVSSQLGLGSIFTASFPMLAQDPPVPGA